jgi:hypothetical protein
VNYIREFELKAGVPRDSGYDFTMYVLAAMLVAGAVCNHFVKPLKHDELRTRREISAMITAVVGGV